MLLLELVMLGLSMYHHAFKMLYLNLLLHALLVLRVPTIRQFSVPTLKFMQQLLKVLHMSVLLLHLLFVCQELRAVLRVFHNEKS